MKSTVAAPLTSHRGSSERCRTVRTPSPGCTATHAPGAWAHVHWMAAPAAASEESPWPRRSRHRDTQGEGAGPRTPSLPAQQRQSTCKFLLALAQINRSVTRLGQPLPPRFPHTHLLHRRNPAEWTTPKICQPLPTHPFSTQTHPTTPKIRQLAQPVPSRTCLLQRHRVLAYAASTPARQVLWPYPPSPPHRRSYCCRRCCRPLLLPPPAHGHVWPSSVNARIPPAIIRILYRRIQSLKCCSRALQPFRFLFSPFCCLLRALHTHTHVRCADGWMGGIVIGCA